MGVRDGRLKKRDKLDGTAMKFRAGQAGPLKGCLPDPAHGKGAVAETGEVKIRVVGYAVEGHTVEKGFPEKVWGKTRLCCPVIEPLVNNFQRTLRIKVKGAVLILLVAALGVGLGQKPLLRQKCLYFPGDFIYPLSVAIAACIPQAGQKSVHCPFCPALQNIIDRPYRLGAVSAVVVLRPHILQKISGADADLVGAQDFLIFAYGIRLLLRKRKCVSP